MFKRTELKTDDHNFIIEEFDSISELINISNNRNFNFDKELTPLHELKDCQNKLAYGDTYALEKVKEVIKPNKQSYVPKTKFTNDVVGFAPVVPNAIKGIPQSMINNIKVPIKNKIINIVFNSGTPWGTSKEEVLEYGKKLLSKIINLEMQGFRVNLYSLLTFNSHLESDKVDGKHTSYFMKLLVKRDNQPLDVKRIIFPMLRDTMQRVIGFDWYRKLPNAKQFSGYGCELCTMIKTKREDLIKPIKDKNTYYICHGDDLEQVFKDVK